MPAALPETKANELLNEIADLLLKPNKPDRFTLKRLQKEIDKLSFDYMEPKSVLTGYLNILEGNVEDGLACFESASELHGNTYYIVKNYLHALGLSGRNISRWNKLMQYAKESKVPSIIIGALDKASEYADLSNIEECLALIKPMRESFTSYQDVIDEAKERLDLYDEMFKGLGIVRNDVVKAISTILNVLELNNTDYVYSRIGNCDDEFLDVEFSLNESSEIIFSLNDKLIDTWIDLDESPRKIIPRLTIANSEVEGERNAC